MSRVVSGLAKRRIVQREAHPGDGRGVRLALTKHGTRLYHGLIRAAAERDHALRRCLSSKEKDMFERVLSKLAGQARELIQQEK